MGPSELVKEEIAAGAEFVDRVDKSLGIKAAYWLKLDDEDRRRFYVVFAGGPGELNPEQYLKIRYALESMPNPYINEMRIRITSEDGPMAGSVLKYQEVFGGMLPVHLVDDIFGGRSVDEIYIYPPPVPVAAS